VLLRQPSHALNPPLKPLTWAAPRPRHALTPPPPPRSRLGLFRQTTDSNPQLRAIGSTPSGALAPSAPTASPGAEQLNSDRPLAAAVPASAGAAPSSGADAGAAAAATAATARSTSSQKQEGQESDQAPSGEAAPSKGWAPNQQQQHQHQHQHQQQQTGAGGVPPLLQLPRDLKQAAIGVLEPAAGSPAGRAQAQAGSLLQQALQASSRPASPAASPPASPFAADRSAPGTPSAAGAAAWRAVPSASPGGSPRAGAAAAAGAGGMPSYGSGPALAPRKPRAQRQVAALQEAESRERRKSERRLSKGAQIAWSTCQIIESRELKIVSAIGQGAYGKVRPGRGLLVQACRAMCPSFGQG
jgi:hypothetical protein